MMKMITERLKFADVFPDKAATVAQRLHIKKDEIPFVRKYYTAEKDKSEVNKKERAVVSYISTGIKDRDGEKLVPGGVLLDNFQKNPVVPFAHDYKSIPPAKNMWIKRDEKGLVAKTVFAKSQRAEELYKAYTEDVGGTGPLLNAFSVGFIPLEWEDTDTKALEKDPDLPKRIYNKWELLEYSLVPIPSCAEALTIAVEKGLISKKLQKELEIEVVKDVPDREIEVEKDAPKSPKGIITYSEEKEIVGEAETRVEEEFALAVGYLGDLSNLKYEVIEDEPGRKKERMSTIGKPSGERNYERIKGLGWVRIIKGEKEVEVEMDEKKEFEGVTAEWLGGKDADYQVDNKGRRIIFKDIEEAEKDIDELLVIDSEGLLESKIISFAKKYGLNSDSEGKYSAEQLLKDFEQKYNLKFTLNEEGKAVITKPETTENFHHIPVNPGCKITATITISATKGIKATYCGEEKKIHTYLFDVKKFSMSEAQAWVKENHKRELEEAIQKYFTEGIEPENEEYEEIIKSIIEEADKETFKEEKTEEKTEKQVESEEKEAPEEIDSLRDPVIKELEEVKDEDREVQLSEEEKGVLYTGGFMSKEMAVDILKASHKELIQEKNDHIADLKAGRVLSRKNRNIVKDAITALNAVLKADATGTQEDEEVEEEGKITGTGGRQPSGILNRTERTVELVKDGDKKTFAVKDIEFLVEGLVEKKAKKMLEDSFEKQSDPEIIKKRVLETIKLEIDKRKGKVR